jgi:hypothetical protein
MDEQEVRRRRSDADGDEERELQEWRATHHTLSERVERMVMQMVILGLVALVLVQMLLVSPAIRRVANLMEGTDGIALNADPAWQVATGQSMAKGQSMAEGQSMAKEGYDEPEAAVAASTAPAEMTVTVFLVTRPSAPAVKLLVGGRPAGDFARGTVTARVEPGQTVAVDATAVAEKLTFRVIGSKGLASPALGAEVTTEGSRQSLGMVRPAARQ